MTPEQAKELMIKTKVEKWIDRLDKRYINGDISEKEYREQIKAIDKWADLAYSGLA